MMNFGNEDSVVKAGWLTKLGGNAIRKTWKRRWFVLKGNSLYYYRDQNCREASGMVNLSLYNSISRDTTVTKKSQYCIRIEKVVKESDSTHCNLSTYHHDISSPSSSPSTSSIFSTPVSIIPSSKHSYKISRSLNNNNNNNSCKDNNNNVFSARSSLAALKKPLTFVVFTDDENEMDEWMTLLEKCLGGRNIVDIVLDRLDLANIGMHKRQGSYSSLRSFYSKNSSFCSSNGSTTTNSNISSRRPSLDSSSFDTFSLDSRKSSMDSFRGNQNTVTSHMTITTTNGGNSNVSSHQSISRPETPSNLVALFGIGQPILRKPASHGCLQDRRNDINNDTNHKSANSSISSTSSSSINDIIVINNSNNNNNDKDFNANVHNITSSPPSSMSPIDDTKSSNSLQSTTPLIMVHNESSKIIPSSLEIINSNDDEDSLVTIDKN